MDFSTDQASALCGHANTLRRQKLWCEVATRTFERFHDESAAVMQANRAVFRQVVKDTSRRSEPVQLRLF
jgi:hypothetical protein